MRFLTYLGHIWDHGNLVHSNMIQTPGGRAGSSLSTDRPGYSSAQKFQEDKLIESAQTHVQRILLSNAPVIRQSVCFYQCINEFIMSRKLLSFQTELNH